MTSPLLEVRGLSVEVQRGRRWIRVVDNVFFELDRGEAIGLVGESGCGKSLTLRALMGILPGSARVAGGSVFADDTELPLRGRGTRAARRKRLALVSQDPSSALNPVMRVGVQVAEAPRWVLGMSRSAARTRALELLGLVGIPDPSRRAEAFPHELSGGMRQRVVLAIALSSQPQILLCDEPTTALDVTIQAQVLVRLRELQASMGLGLVFVTHDLAVMAQVCNQVAVMYAGRIVERGAARAVVDDPKHPYSAGLLRSAVDLDLPIKHSMAAIPGELPDPERPMTGCPFRPRCSLARADCEEGVIALLDVGVGRSSACLHWDELHRLKVS